VQFVITASLAVIGSQSAVRSAPTTIINNGSPANRVDLVFVGDGYTQADLTAGLYDQHIQTFLNHTFTTGGILVDPFPRYKNFFNVHKITVVSNQSGADIPSQSIFRDTALDATYETGGPNGPLTIDTDEADALLNAELAGTGIDANVQLAAVNHSMYSGSTFHGWAIYSAANLNAPDLELHELGHAYGWLLDEYGGSPATYTGPEPTEVRNITKDPTGQKWSHWLGFVDPRDATLTIGVHEGAAGYDHGLYRPSLNSKMRSLYRPFDAVSRESFIHSIYQDVDPLDDWLDNAGTLIDDELWVDVVDPDVIQLQWFVDDVLVAGASDESFRPRAFGYGPGTFEVRARAYDEVFDHSFSGDLLDLMRSDFDDLEQSVTWSLTITPGIFGDYDGNGFVETGDYELWKKTFGSTELLAADGNNDGTVNVADFVLWRKMFDLSGSASGAGAIPEPNSAAIGFIAIAICAASPAAARRSFRGSELRC
jgi:hypothetical protein